MSRTKAIEAYRILNDFILDLITGMRSITLFERLSLKGRNPKSLRLGFNRMALGYLFITLFKWVEFYNRYKSIIPDEFKDECKKIMKEIKNRGILKFRNSYLGHIYDKDSKRALTHKEINSMYVNIINDDLNSFLEWINYKDADYPRTVVSVSESVRDEIGKRFKLSERDVFAV